MNEPETIRCDWCRKARKPSAYAGDDKAHLMIVCAWCRGVETRRNGTADHARKWMAKEMDLQRQADQIEAILKKGLQGEKKGVTVFEL